MLAAYHLLLVFFGTAGHQIGRHFSPGGKSLEIQSTPVLVVLPGFPLTFGLLYIFLSVVEEPFRPDLLFGGVFSLVVAAVLAVLVLTSRIIIDQDTLDVRRYGLLEPFFVLAWILVSAAAGPILGLLLYGP